MSEKQDEGIQLASRKTDIEEQATSIFKLASIMVPEHEQAVSRLGKHVAVLQLEIWNGSY